MKDEEMKEARWRINLPWQKGRVKMKEKEKGYSEIMNRWTLLFRDPALEREFDTEHGTRYMRSQKIGLFLLFILLAIVSGIAGVGYGFNRAVIYVDFIMTGWIGLFFCIMWIPFLFKYMQHLLAFCFCGWAIMLIYNEQMGDPEFHEYIDISCTWVAMVLCVEFTILRVKFWMAMCVAAVVYLTDLITVIIVFYVYGDRTWYACFTSSFTIAGASFFAGYCGYHIERQLRIELIHKKILEIEGKRAMRIKMRDDKILQNIFPKSLTEKLKTRQTKATPRFEEATLGDSYQCVSVLLCDIVGFTAMSSKISPQELVTILNSTFSMFDVITEKMHMEKIRTIGDAYLCVGNMSLPLENHQEMAVEVGLSMLHSVQQLRQKLGHTIDLRIGISCGPVIAGVTGTSKWNYDIFGTTLTQAASLERNGIPGSIVVSRDIVDALRTNPNYFFEQKFPSPRDENGVEFEAYKVTDERVNENLLSGSVFKSPSYSAVLQKKENSHLNMLAADWNADMEGDEEDSLGDILFSKYYQAFSKDFDTPKQSAKKLLIGDLMKKDDSYSNENLQKEMETFQKKRFLRMKFSDATYEHDFWRSIAANLRNYSSRLTLLLVVWIIFFLIEDLAIGPLAPSAVRIEVWIFYVIIIALLGALAALARTQWFQQDWTEWLCAGTLCVGGLLFIMISYFDQISVFHFHRIILYIFACYQYVRVRIKVMFIFSIPQVIFGFVMTTIYLDYRGDPHTLMGLFPGAVIIAFIGNFFLARSLRKGFLLIKMIRNDLAQQNNDKERTKLLLHNIFPEQILPRLKPGVQHLVDYFDNATIMFVTLSNFHNLSHLHASKVLSLLNELFTTFDDLTFKSGLEKIKTINASYMVASGIPVKRKDHAEAAIMLALRMYAAFSDLKDTSPYLNGTNLRVGIACGPVVAGIIGRTKYSYDCWSDTANTASRMETNGMDGYMQVTPDVFNAVKENNKFAFTKRDAFEVKGKGSMTSYLLSMQQQLEQFPLPFTNKYSKRSVSVQFSDVVHFSDAE